MSSPFVVEADGSTLSSRASVQVQRKVSWASLTDKAKWRKREFKRKRQLKRKQAELAAAASSSVGDDPSSKGAEKLVSVRGAEAPPAAKRRRLGDNYNAMIKARPLLLYLSFFAPVKKEGLFFFSFVGNRRARCR